MEFFGDLTTVCGVQVLNEYLGDRSYIQGFSPTVVDAEVFNCLAYQPDAKYPHALRWYQHIKALGINLLAGKSSKQEKPKKSVDAKIDDEEEIDLFASDDEEESSAAAQVREERLRAYAEKKANKPGPIAKSSVMLDVKPWDDETSMSDLEQAVRGISMDGLVWGASKLNPLAFGINKLSILCVVEDEKVSIDDLIEKICEFEDHAQSVDIASFNKI